MFFKNKAAPVAYDADKIINGLKENVFNDKAQQYGFERRAKNGGSAGKCRFKCF